MLIHPRTLAKVLDLDQTRGTLADAIRDADAAGTIEYKVPEIIGSVVDRVQERYPGTIPCPAREIGAMIHDLTTGLETESDDTCDRRLYEKVLRALLGVPFEDRPEHTADTSLATDEDTVRAAVDLAIDLVCAHEYEAEVVARYAADLLFSTRDMSGRERISSAIARARRMLEFVAMKRRED